MKLTKEELHQVKITMIGIQGSGKTFRSKQLVKAFKRPLIYGVYPFEWENEPERIEIFIPKDFTMDTFEKFAGELIKATRKE